MLKTLLYIISGLFLIAAAVCAGIFYHHGSIQALGGTLMFLCFGAFGMFIGFNLDTLKPQTSWQPSAQRR
jgi:hypothetical protein